MKRYLDFCKRKVSNLFITNKKKSIATLFPKSKKIKGRVLVSYLLESAFFTENDKRFNGHSNKWESREIANIFNRLGYVVDVINFDDHSFYPQNNYDIIFDIHVNLQRLLPFLDKKTIKILHMTGSYAPYQNFAEIDRVKSFEKRKSAFYSPKRLDLYEHLVERSLNYSDFCSLIGNDFILNTYPEKYRKKIIKVPVSASSLNFIKTINNFIPKGREFLWFFGGGAVHKGLDLVLDVFSKNKNLVLNVIGVAENERDFWKIYRAELTTFPNIRYHGFLLPTDKKFVEVIKKVFCFIAPSCSESISASVATCLQIGLFPIISRNTGVDLPNGCGIYLKDLSVEEIEKNVIKASSMQKMVLEDQIFACQKKALKSYSRDEFSYHMTKFITESISRKRI